MEATVKSISYSGLPVCQKDEIQITGCLAKPIDRWSKWQNCYLWKQSCESELNLPCSQETKPWTQVIQWRGSVKNQNLVWKLEIGAKS